MSSWSPADMELRTKQRGFYPSSCTFWKFKSCREPLPLSLGFPRFHFRLPRMPRTGFYVHGIFCDLNVTYAEQQLFFSFCVLIYLLFDAGCLAAWLHAVFDLCSNRCAGYWSSEYDRQTDNSISTENEKKTKIYKNLYMSTDLDRVQCLWNIYVAF